MLSPLMIAVASGDKDVCNILLLNKTFDISYREDKWGVSAFWLACLNNNIDIMVLLAKNGADIYVKDLNQINVLHLAVFKNNC